jgi:hypothetical protein
VNEDQLREGLQQKFTLIERRLQKASDRLERLQLLLEQRLAQDTPNTKRWLSRHGFQCWQKLRARLAPKR